MFTQLNQYHVVLEVKPGFEQNPVDLRDLFIRYGRPSAGGLRRVHDAGDRRTVEFGGGRQRRRAGPGVVRRDQRGFERGLRQRPIASTAAFPTAARFR